MTHKCSDVFINSVSQVIMLRGTGL